MSEQQYSPENFTKITEADKSKLLSELAAIYNPQFSTLGHGTNPQLSEKILRKGLTSEQPDLFSTTYPLFDTEVPYEEQSDKLLNLLTHWPHHDAKAIAIVMIPNPDKDASIKGRAYFNSVFEELPDNERGLHANYVIPFPFIRGVVDVERLKFIENPNFHPYQPEPKTPLSNSLLDGLRKRVARNKTHDPIARVNKDGQQEKLSEDDEIW
jgi:hypothetical protein